MHGHKTGQSQYMEMFHKWLMDASYMEIKKDGPILYGYTFSFFCFFFFTIRLIQGKLGNTSGESCYSTIAGVISNDSSRNFLFLQKNK